MKSKVFLKSIFSISLLSAISLQSQTPGINLSYIDSSYAPGTDFYNYCNSKWEKKFVLPESDARYGSFNEINDNNLKKIKNIYETVAKNKALVPNSSLKKMRDFYVTAMDSLKANTLGWKPLEEQLKKIDAIKTPEELMKLKSEFDYLGVNLFFGAGVSPDLKNSKKNIFWLSQAGYGLGDRDYYTDGKYDEIRKEYKKYIAELFSLIGLNKAESERMSVETFDFENRIVTAAFTRVQLRDVEKQYNLFDKKKLNELTPMIKWDEYFTSKKMTRPDTVNIAQVDFIREMCMAVYTTPVDIVKSYIKGQLLMEAAPFLSDKFEAAHFNFRGKVMSGAKKMKARYQKVHNFMNSTIGEILSEEFVKAHFTPEAKMKVNKMIDNLIVSYRERIASRAWMSEETKKQANKKLDLLIRKIGYPEKWKNYSSLVVSNDSYWANVCRANSFATIDNYNDLKKPVDRMKWQMTPVTVNAYYDPSTNEITFPAAILQPPFFDAKADDAANYGTMGAIIGHELTHGFDDQGSQFDASGNMVMWWTETDFKNFKDKTQGIINQFNNYVAIDTLKVKGAQTQGENIADLGGLTMSYYAYKKSLGTNPSPKIGGYTGEQRFFIAWAQGWKTICRPEEMKRLLTIDFHSPGKFRAFAPLTNMKEFYEAFNVKAGEQMWTPDDKRVEIW